MYSRNIPMLNFLSTLIAILGYQSGYFWLLLFIANAVCRYNCNRLKILLWSSLSSVAIYYMLAYNGIAWSINFYFFSQSSLCILSFAYNIYRRNWQHDYLFFWIEPILATTFVLYLISPVLMMQNVNKFFIVYLLLQAFVALWDILGLKIYVRDSKIEFALVSQSPLNEMLDVAWLKFSRKDADLSGEEKKKKKLSEIIRQDEFKEKYIDLWKNQK